MTEDELNRIHRECLKMVAARGSVAGLKAVLIGSEKLGKLYKDIADAYGLDQATSELLQKQYAVQISDFVAKIAPVAKAPVELPAAIQLAKLAKDAQQTKTLMATGLEFLRNGLTSADAIATGSKAIVTSGEAAGKAAGKAFWIILVAYGAGTALWFFWFGHRFNAACYDHQFDRLMKLAQTPHQDVAAQ